jgi:hypothetical protein
LNWSQAGLFLSYPDEATGCAMERFIRNENIRRYRKLLEEETDEEKRNIIRKLLAEEEAREIPPKPNRNDDKSKRP